ncbi:hypothetical protein Tco_0038152 [Tanacetum coccineum]
MESHQGNVTRLNIISCTEHAEEHGKRFPIFLCTCHCKELKTNSEKNGLEDVPIDQYFPEVFPEDLAVSSSTRQVEFFKDWSWSCNICTGTYRMRLRDGKKPLNPPQRIDDLFESELPRVECLLEIRPKVRLSPIGRIREEDISEDCLQNSLLP